MWTFHTGAEDAILFGQAAPSYRWDLVLLVGLLIGILGFGLWAIVRIRRWRVEILEEETVSSSELTIEHFEKLVADGLLDPEEFARIKARLEASAPATTNGETAAKEQSPDTSFQEK